MKGQRFLVLVAGVLVGGWGSLAFGTVCCLPDGTCLTDADGIGDEADCLAVDAEAKFFSFPGVSCVLCQPRACCLPENNPINGAAGCAEPIWPEECGNAGGEAFPGETCDEVECGEPEACCRITGGGNDCAFDFTSDDCDLAQGQAKKFTNGPVNSYTMGGQCGAPGSDFGEWTHTNHNGPAGRFTFHAGTHSAPANTFIQVVECSEPVCDPAMANGEVAKIICEGVGSFKNGGPAGLFNVQIRIADYGEPGHGKPKAKDCPGPNGFDDAFSTDACGCPDWYEIHIWNGGGFTYDVEGYIRGGNMQMHNCKD